MLLINQTLFSNTSFNNFWDLLSFGIGCYSTVIKNNQNKIEKMLYINMEFSDIIIWLSGWLCLLQNSMPLYEFTVTSVTADLTKTNIPHHNINIIQRIITTKFVHIDNLITKKISTFDILTDHYLIQVS